jgi:prevent-host-death family protein
MNLKEVVKSITYLKNNTADVIRVVSESGRPYVVTQNGEAKAVVMGVDQYQEWRRTMALLKLAAQGEADIAAGRVVEQTETFERAKKAVRRASGDE